MRSEEIQQMFIDMGLGFSEQRDKLIKEFSINMDSSQDSVIDIITRSNTLIPEHYA